MYATFPRNWGMFEKKRLLTTVLLVSWGWVGFCRLKVRKLGLLPRVLLTVSTKAASEPRWMEQKAIPLFWMELARAVPTKRGLAGLVTSRMETSFLSQR